MKNDACNEYNQSSFASDPLEPRRGRLSVGNGSKRTIKDDELRDLRDLMNGSLSGTPAVAAVMT
jgi:hypothetical protein